MPAALIDSLERHNAAFERLLALIPAKHYIRTETDQDQYGNKYMKNKKSNSMPKQDIKERSKKAKKDKLDPSNNFSLPEILSGRTAAGGADSDDDDDNAAMSDADSTTGDGQPSTSSLAGLQPLPPSTSIAALHAKLQERIASLQGKRFDKPVDAGYPARGGAPAAPEPGSKEELLAEARKRRGELRDNRRNARKEERRKEAAGKSKPAAAAAGAEKKKKAAEGELSVRPGKTTLLVPDLKAPPPGANVSFSQFKLPSTFGASTSSSSSSKRATKPLPSNPTQALSVLAAQKAKLAELPDDVRVERQDEARWSKALERAEGGKVRDDAGRLKKAAKRKEKEKAKSSTEWADRKEHLKNSLSIKQKKRSDNIASRLEARKNARKGVKPKGDKAASGKKGGGGGGGKSRGGFEGKKGPGGK